MEGVERRYSGGDNEGVWSMRWRSGQVKRTRWWNEEVKSAVQKKKVLFP